MKIKMFMRRFVKVALHVLPLSGLFQLFSLEDNLLQVCRAGLCGGWDLAEWCLKML